MIQRTTQPSSIPGYTFGTLETAISPVSDEDLRRLEETVSWSEADAVILQKYADLFREQAEQMVDTWRGVIAGQPHLAQWFLAPDGRPDEQYKARVKRRFIQWVVDVALRPHDREWLSYQEEIGLRHTPAKKNATDQGHTPPLVPLRYLLSFVPVILPLREFFGEKIQDEMELNKLGEAWTKAVVLHITLWSRPYALEGFW